MFASMQTCSMTKKKIDIRYIKRLGDFIDGECVNLLTERQMLQCMNLLTPLFHDFSRQVLKDPNYSFLPAIATNMWCSPPACRDQTSQKLALQSQTRGEDAVALSMWRITFGQS